MNYPRVLLVHMAKVHADDPINIIVRTLFGDWPRENIAQIYTGCYSGTGEFCGEYYAIGRKERRLGKVFGMLKPAAVTAIAGRSVNEKRIRSKISFVKIFISKIVEIIINSGFWEEIFRIHPSDELIEFVRKFRPDIIYTEGYSIGFTRLALQLAQKVHLPIIYFPVDDWHSYLYQDSPLHSEVDRLAKEIAKKASVRFALGPKMARELTERYRLEFECIHNADDITRFNEYKNGKSDNERIIIGLTGSLYLGRSAGLSDLARVCKLLDRKFKIMVYCSSVPEDVPADLLNGDIVEFHPLPSHDELPCVLSKCDILFLPESFDPVYRKAIELSISSKSHLYMMSGRPVLIYGPPWSGTVDYARSSGWGVVIDRRDDRELARGLNEFSFPDTVREIVAKAATVVKKNHDIELLRKHILERLTFAVKDFA